MPLSFNLFRINPQLIKIKPMNQVHDRFSTTLFYQQIDKNCCIKIIFENCFKTTLSK